MKYFKKEFVPVLFLAVSSMYGYHLYNLAPKSNIVDTQVNIISNEFSSQNAYDAIRNWIRPDGPPRVGIQVGHLDHQDAPEEQKRLRNNSGASAGGISEVDINSDIAARVASILETQGIAVDILPTTIPPGYWADAFITIHADGNDDINTRGFKFARPWRDFTGNADELVKILEANYAQATRLPQDPTITRNMRGYYAFSWWRFTHAIHPMTPAVIAETGFITNALDRELLSKSPDIPATAIAESLIQFLTNRNLI